MIDWQSEYRRAHAESMVLWGELVAYKKRYGMAVVGSFFFGLTIGAVACIVLL